MKLLRSLRDKRNLKNISKKKKGSSFTMMLIPHAQGAAVRNIPLSVWLLKVIALIGVTGVFTVGFFVYGYFSLRDNSQEIKELRQINLAQSVEIQELKGVTGDMKNKLEALMEIDREVRAKVGLAEPAKESDVLKELKETSTIDNYTLLTMGLVERPFPSRSMLGGFPFKAVPSSAAQGIGLPQTPSQNAQISLEEIDTLTELKEELVEMDRLLTEQAEAMDKLKYDVEKQIAEELALPEAWPIQGVITSKFGMRNNPFDHSQQERHEGLDIDGSYGAPIRAAGNGVVTFAGSQGAWGNAVIVSHGFGYVSKYAHNASLLVKKGDKVERGQIIARLGSTGRATGAHLHFGIAYNGEWIDPLTVLK